MTKQTADILARWHELDMAERLAFLEELMQQDALDENTIAALHELFIQEAQQMGENDVLDMLLSDVLDRATQQEESTKKRRVRKKSTTSAKMTDSDSDAQDEEQPKRRRRTRKKTSKNSEFVQETMLELAEDKKGMLILREVGSDDVPLVRIEFSDKVKELLGGDVRMIGQAMIHAAIASVVQRQANFWHAQVYDEEPTHYS